jgi:hypothetical protein
MHFKWWELRGRNPEIVLAGNLRYIVPALLQPSVPAQASSKLQKV